MNRFQSILFRCYFVLMLGLLAWSVLTYAQPANPPAVRVEVRPEAPTTLSFGLHRVPEFRYEVIGIPIWQYIASAIYVALAFLVARVFDNIATVQLRKLAGRTKWKVDDWFVELLHGPVRMLVLVVMLQMGLNLYRWPGWMEKWLKNGLNILLACSITYAIIRLVDLLATYWRNRPAAQAADKTFNELLVPLVSKTLKALILIMALLVTLDNIGFNIRTLLAGVSISGLALGLAAQDTIGNLFGAAAVFVDKPFKIGDMVKSGDVQGTVEEIGLRSTRLRNPDGHLITVPNKTMGNATITNITRRPNIKTTMNIGLTYDMSVEKVERAVAILKEAFGTHPMTQDLIIGFNQFADNALNIQLIHWWKGLDYKEYLAGLQELNLKVKRQFDAEGISFAFPSRTIYLRQEGDWNVQSIDPERPAA